jgi:hypothetical protein
VGDFIEATMALRGNLRDFTITQLLNLINLAQKSGTLVVDGPGEYFTDQIRRLFTWVEGDFPF